MSTYSTFKEKEYSRYQVYASQFIEFRKALETAKETFSQEQIWPDQCDYLLYKIRPLQKTATNIAELAHLTKKQASKTTKYNHYPLLVSAHYFCDQIDILVSFIREYKETPENRSAKKSKQRLIISSLYSLDSSFHDLMKELDKTM
jgi:hypothetical protein